MRETSLVINKLKSSYFSTGSTRVTTKSKSLSWDGEWALCVQTVPICEQRWKGAQCVCASGFTANIQAPSWQSIAQINVKRREHQSDQGQDWAKYGDILIVSFSELSYIEQLTG